MFTINEGDLIFNVENTDDNCKLHSLCTYNLSGVLLLKDTPKSDFVGQNKNISKYFKSFKNRSKDFTYLKNLSKDFKYLKNLSKDFKYLKNLSKDFKYLKNFQMSHNKVTRV